MIKVETFVFNPFQVHCFVVWDDVSRHCLFIDPGMCCDAEWQRLHRFIVENELVPDRILLTHCHSDHVVGTGYLTREYPGLPICGSVEDQNHLPSVMEMNQMFRVETEIHWAPITQNVIEGDRFTLETDGGEAAEIQVLDCPGHSHHGLCYYFPAQKLLFSGDVLFFNSIGRADFGPAMGGDAHLLIQGILNKLLTLPGDVRVFPGHGPLTTISYEASYNPFL